MMRATTVLSILVALGCAPKHDGMIDPAVEERLVQLESRVHTLESAAATRPAPEPSLDEPLSGEVTMRIRTQPVPAKVVVPRTGDVIGVTNGDDGIALPMSSEPIDLILRADGYEELLFSVIPDRNKAFSKQLRRK